MSSTEPQQDAAAAGRQAEGNEISRIDLLGETAVSHGRFYRWKRMRLTLEAWFHRRSTFTGQGTFLPRQKALDRIRQIRELKSRYPLDRTARMLWPDVVERCYDPADLAAMDWISARAQALFPAPGAQNRPAGFLELLCWSAIEHLLAVGSVPDDQIVLAAETLHARFGELDPLATERRLTVTVRSRNTGMLTAESIEGDRVYLESTQADVVRGREVSIGPSCRIRRVEYSQSLQVDPTAEVAERKCTGDSTPSPAD